MLFDDDEIRRTSSAAKLHWKANKQKNHKKKYQYNPFLTSDFIVWVQFAETFTVAICLNAIPQNPLGISIVPNYTKA